MRDPFSRRFPRDPVPNAWSAALAARRASGARLLDLSESNPTAVGLPSLLAGGLPVPPPSAGDYRPEPCGLAAARRAIADFVARRHGPVAPEDVVVTTGTSESLAHLFRLLAAPGEAIAVPRPGYPLFDPIASAEGIGTVPYRLAWDGGWHLDRGAFDRAIGARPRAVALVEPHLPAGVRLDPGDWAWVEERTVAAGIPRIVDEVFADDAWDAAGGFPGRVRDDAGLGFVLGGLSKTCGLPQLKLGWIVLRGEPGLRATARAGLEWLADLFLAPAPPLQSALPELLARREAFREPLRARLRENLATLDGWAVAHPEATRLPAAGGWVAILRLPERLGDEAWALELLRRGVAVHPGHFYDLELPATLVVSLIVEPAVLREGLEEIAGALTGA